MVYKNKIKMNEISVCIKCGCDKIKIQKDLDYSYWLRGECENCENRIYTNFAFGRYGKSGEYLAIETWNQHNDKNLIIERKKQSILKLKKELTKEISNLNNIYHGRIK